MSETSGTSLPTLSSRDALLATMSRGSYDSGFQLPASSGFERLDIILRNDDGTQYVPSNGFSAQAWINKATGEVVIAYRGSDELKDFIGADAAAIGGRWHAQFDDAGRFATAARNAANEALVEYARQEGMSSALSPNLLATGHSLGGMLAQVACRLLGIEGRAFDAPGVQALTETPGFQALARSLGEPEAGHVVGAQQFVSYQTGLVGNLGGAAVGSQASILALNDPSLTPFLVGVGLGVLNPLLCMTAMAAGGSILDTHGMTGIERAVYGLLELQGRLDAGQLRVVDMPYDQASGQPWTYEGPPISTKVILDAQGNILAYADRNNGVHELVIRETGTRLIFTQENGVPKLEERRSDGSAITHNVGEALNQTPQHSWSSDNRDGNQVTASIESDGASSVDAYDAEGALLWQERRDADGALQERTVHDAQDTQDWDKVCVAYEDGQAVGFSFEQDADAPAGSENSIFELAARAFGALAPAAADAETLAGLGLGAAAPVGAKRMIGRDESGVLVVRDTYADRVEVRADDDAEGFTYLTLSDDGRVEASRYDAQYKLKEDFWTRADGSAGSDTYGGDGSVSGEAYRADGGYNTYARNTDGYTTFYDEAETQVGQINIAIGPQASVFIPTPTSLSSTLNYSGSFYASQLDYAQMAEGVRIFVGLSTLNQTTTSECTPEEGSEAMINWARDLTDLAGPRPLQNDNPNNFSSFDWDMAYRAMSYLPDSYFVLNENSEWNYKGIGKAAWETGSPDIISIGFSNYSGYVAIDLLALLSSNIASSLLSYLPVVLDLDGDGVELVARNASHAWYDLLGDGSRVHCGWVGADDGLLAIDDDGDNEIGFGREIVFGLFTPEDDTDMEALAAVFDTNADGLLDAQDARFADFRLWQDTNGNGESDEGELKTLTEAGIASVGLVPDKVDYESGGNRILGFSSFTRTDASTGWVADVAFGFEGEGAAVSEDNGYLRVNQKGSMTYAVGTGGALNLELAANELEGALGSAVADSLFAGNREDGILLDGNGGNDTLSGGLGDDWLAGGVGADTISAGVGNDTILFDAADLAIDGGDGFDTALVSGTAGVTLDLGVANLESAVGGDGADTLYTSGTARVILSGGGGNDALTGGDGSDLLTGGAGNDALAGRLGNDLYVYIRGDGADTVNDTGGFDTIEFGRGIELADLDAELSGNDLVLGLRDWSTDGGTVAGLAERIVLKSWMNLNLRVERVSFADGTLEDIAGWRIGTAAANALTGGATDDRMYGGAGNDTLDGGLGADRMFGGLGDDTYFVDEDGDEVHELVNGGNDIVKSWVDFTLGVNVENLLLLGSAEIEGKGNDLNNVLTGNLVTNELRGYGGADTLDGGAGADVMHGGAGNDTYVVDDVDDKAKELADEGTDSVLSSVTFELEDFVENLTLTGTLAIDGKGNDGNNVLTGNAVANRLEGFDGNDTLDGGAGIDTLVGGAGNDVYIVDSAQDVVSELADEGIDTVRSGTTLSLADNVENLILTGVGAIGGTGNDLDNVLTGNSAINSLTGGAGNDTLDGGAGGDTMSGGMGDDTYVVDHASDTVSEAGGGGEDTVRSGITYSLGADVENLVLTGSAAINGTGNLLDNTLTGNAGANVLDGGAGADTLVGGGGDDTYTVDNAGDSITEAAGEGLDLVNASVTYTLAANVEKLTLTGTEAINGTGNESDNTLKGNAAANVLTGGAGNDSLDGQGGADTMAGGTGDDTYTVDIADDVIVELADEGIDSVVSAIAWTLGENIDNLTLTGTAAVNGTGNGLNNVLLGNSANNTLTGGEGNDVLNGGAGIDQMFGGAGDDSYYVDVSGDVITENPGAGTDTVFSAVTVTLGANLENLTLTGTAAINGTGNALDNKLFGNAAVNQLNGGAGNDIIDGGASNDTMAGGTGDDTYYVNAFGDIVNEAAEEGSDTVKATATYVLADSGYVENLELTGTAAINGTGNAIANILTGNAASNALDGRGGADTMRGGAGNDTYWVDTAGDIVEELEGEGEDTVTAAVTYTLVSQFVENLTLGGTAVINGTGNESANKLTGNGKNNELYGLGGDDILDGGLGNDRMEGGLGDDIYYVNATGDTVVEQEGQGTDTVVSSASYSLGTTLENLTLANSGITGTGNSGNNRLVCSDSGNTLYGLDGDDTLEGGLGADTLMGGLGNDTYWVNMSYSEVTDYGDDGYGNLVPVGSHAEAAYDTVEESAGAGSDSVMASYSYTLAANFENLTLIGTEALNGTGNAEVNTIAGNVAANILDGKAGNDTMRGGAGNDTYVVDAAGDIVEEYSGEGIDTVQSAVAFTLGDNLENLTLTGTQAIGGNGNELANILIGNSAANTLYGFAGKDVLSGGIGADTMHGGADDDAYLVDDLGDTVVELAGEGTDTVQSSKSFMLSDYVENLTLAGSAAISGTGNTLSNMLKGNNGANTLVGLAGNDVIDGGAGGDTMKGGADNDRYYVDSAYDSVDETDETGADAGGIDTVLAAATHTLSDFVENLTLTGKTAINGNGNGSDNFINGNIAGNILRGYIGNDILNGGAGSDRMEGGVGDDTYYVDIATDNVVELAGEGNDTILSSASYTLKVNVENLTLAGVAMIDAIGNDLKNHLIGNVSKNTLDGKLGADIMEGGQGGDTYVVDDIGDVVKENADEGLDMVKAYLIYTLTEESNVEGLTLMGTVASGTGNSLDNRLVGNAAANTLTGLGGNDYLDGMGGVDILIGGEGNDTYVVNHLNDVVDEHQNEGDADTIESSVNWSLGTDVENLTLTGTAATGMGNDEKNSLFGNSKNNTLYGLKGNDSLDGGLGNDTMVGGEGDDTYYVNSAYDVVTELDGELEGSSDLVISTVTYVLKENTDVENLTLTGMLAINGTGNALNNELVGNYAKNILNGGLGADEMSGGLGDDTYIVDNLGDVVNETKGEGVDTVQSSVTIAELFANVENLTLTGTAAIDGKGNVLDNYLKGNAVANILDGAAGDDTMEGMAGNDTYFVDSIRDVVKEKAGATNGTDTVKSTISYVLAANVENLILLVSPGGTGNIDGTGNDLNNVLTGNEGNNVLNGGKGNDTIRGGGAGIDTFIGGLGMDTFVIDKVDAMVATISDFLQGTDKLGLDQAKYGDLFEGGVLRAGVFANGTEATTAEQRLFYDVGTGGLFYDSDGNDVGAAVQVATLSSMPGSLTSSSFVLASAI
jgi:Ca2+-binding RTX toxin-like protein